MLPLSTREEQMSVAFYQGGAVVLHIVFGMGNCPGANVWGGKEQTSVHLYLAWNLVKVNLDKTNYQQPSTVDAYFVASTHYPVKDLWRGKAECPSRSLPPVWMTHATCCRTPISVYTSGCEQGVTLVMRVWYMKVVGKIWPGPSR